MENQCPLSQSPLVVGDLVYWQFIDDGRHITRNEVSKGMRMGKGKKNEQGMARRKISSLVPRFQAMGLAKQELKD
jgi:hypothetical protein